MGGKVGKTDSANSEPNVVPLCDILLVLLIIFMVIMPVSQQGIDIKLPETQEKQQQQQQQPNNRAIVLTIEKNGDIMINKRAVSKQMLESELSRLYENRSDENSVVFVQGDKTVPFKEIMSVIDIAKGAGILKVALIPEQYPKE